MTLLAAVRTPADDLENAHPTCDVCTYSQHFANFARVTSLITWACWIMLNIFLYAFHPCSKTVSIVLTCDLRSWGIPTGNASVLAVFASCSLHATFTFISGLLVPYPELVGCALYASVLVLIGCLDLDILANSNFFTSFIVVTFVLFPIFLVVYRALHTWICAWARGQISDLLASMKDADECVRSFFSFRSSGELLEKTAGAFIIQLVHQLSGLRTDSGNPETPVTPIHANKRSDEQV